MARRPAAVTGILTKRLSPNSPRSARASATSDSAEVATPYSASKTALNAVTLAMMTELDGSGIKVNLVSPGFTSTNLNGFEGTQSLEDGSREVVRVCLLGPDGPTDTFTRWENQTIPW